MIDADGAERRATAANRFNDKCQRRDGAEVVDRLDAALRLLSDLVFTRVHGDVEREIGVDSMYDPVSEIKSESRIRLEITAYLACEAALEAQRQLTGAEVMWLAEWVASLRLGAQSADPVLSQRLSSYLAQTSDARRLAFSARLEKTLREAALAPLVLYRLLPLAASLAAAQAFSDTARAEDLRRLQLSLLPSIADCSRCRGRILPPGESCPACGNPVWKFALLTAE